ncbi:phosphatase PAP2 family protein [Hamadaea sp. NPDC050747]|uniref:phosphatase PAP2 family protein n=1 Tax=Hamadaea sp. NPDC050747 TaxID=3155789 RepID=UPI0033DBD693
MSRLMERPSVVHRAAPADPRPHPIRELILVTVLFLAYKAGRLIASGHVDEAYANAGRIWNAERWLRLPSEVSIQAAMLHSPAFVQAVNTYYAWVHFPATAAFLLWTYLRRPAYYLWIRRVLTGLTAAALAVHVLFPLAPPRLVGAFGMIDTAARYGPSVYSEPDTDTLANQYAAMPSLHIGWAVVIALGLIVMTRSRWRWLWLAHPVITTFVVVGTANHYWLDGIVVCAFLALMLLIIRRPGTAPASPPAAPLVAAAIAAPAAPTPSAPAPLAPAPPAPLAPAPGAPLALDQGSGSNLDPRFDREP